MANFVRSAADVLALAPGDRVLQFCSIGFDVSVMEVFPTLLRGATLIPRYPGLPLAASAFSPWLEEHGISVAILPSGYWHVWAAEVARALAEQRGVLGLPGSYFGDGQETHLRIAFANAGLEAIAEIPTRLQGALP